MMKRKLESCWKLRTRESIQPLYLSQDTVRLELITTDCLYKEREEKDETVEQLLCFYTELGENRRWVLGREFSIELEEIAEVIIVNLRTYSHEWKCLGQSAPAPEWENDTLACSTLTNPNLS